MRQLVFRFSLPSLLLILLILPVKLTAVTVWQDNHEDQKNLDLFINEYLENGETFSVGEEVALGDFYYVPVTINESKELLVRIDRSVEPASFALVTDEEEIDRALEKIYA